jgi:hypothetical protein
MEGDKEGGTENFSLPDLKIFAMHAASPPSDAAESGMVGSLIRDKQGSDRGQNALDHQ